MSDHVVPCPECEGKGFGPSGRSGGLHTNDVRRCPACEGRGQIINPDDVERAAKIIYRVDADAGGDSTEWQHIREREQAKWRRASEAVLTEVFFKEAE